MKRILLEPTNQYESQWKINIESSIKHQNVVLTAKNNNLGNLCPNLHGSIFRQKNCKQISVINISEITEKLSVKKQMNWPYISIMHAECCTIIGAKINDVEKMQGHWSIRTSKLHCKIKVYSHMACLPCMWASNIWCFTLLCAAIRWRENWG